MPSKLELLCQELLALSQQMRSLASELPGQAYRIRASREQLVALCSGSGNRLPSSAIESFDNAVIGTERAARSLEAAEGAARMFVDRMTRDQSGGGAAPGAGAAASVAAAGAVAAASGAAGSSSGSPVHFTGADAAKGLYGRRYTDTPPPSDHLPDGTEFKRGNGSCYMFLSPNEEDHEGNPLPYRGWQNGMNVRPYSDHVDVLVHGNPSVVGGVHREGHDLVMDGRQLAGIVRQLPEFDGRRPIRLLSCKTGESSEGVAQQLADELRVPVLAPVQNVVVFPDGAIWSGDARPDKSATPRYADFKTFNPRK